MKLHLVLSLLIAAAFVLPGNAFCQNAAAKKAKPPAPVKGLGLKDGDRFIFIGDSITHQCLYTQYVEDFYYTRYPQMRIKFRNAGVSGDRAADALARFDDDIASFKPTVATILLGMNDASYKDFDAQVFATYAKDMTALMDKLDALKCRVIVMSPTMFDHLAFEKMVAANPDRAKGKQPENYNAVLAYYGKWLQETARKRGYQFADLYGPLNTLTVQQRKTTPDFTFIEDAIHPGPDGQLVMAYSLLQQIGETGGILSAGAKVVNGQWTAVAPTMVSDLSGEPGHNVTYTLMPKALPWTIGEAAPIGYKVTRSGHTGSQESHVVVGLDAGRYDLVINGTTVGNFDERMLGVHAEIEEDPDSPTYKQAMQVVELNRRRNDEAIHPLRNLYSQRKAKLRAAQQSGDMTAFEKWLPELRAQEADLLKKAGAIEDEIYKVNQPKPLRVEIKPGAMPAKPKPAAKKAAAAAAK